MHAILHTVPHPWALCTSTRNASSRLSRASNAASEQETSRRCSNVNIVPVDAFDEESTPPQPQIQGSTAVVFWASAMRNNQFSPLVSYTYGVPNAHRITVSFTTGFSWRKRTRQGSAENKAVAEHTSRHVPAVAFVSAVCVARLHTKCRNEAFLSFRKQEPKPVYPTRPMREQSAQLASSAINKPVIVAGHEVVVYPLRLQQAGPAAVAHRRRQGTACK